MYNLPKGTKTAWEVECEARGLNNDLTKKALFDLTFLNEQLDEIMNMVDSFDNDYATRESNRANKEMITITKALSSAEEHYSINNPYGDSIDLHDIATENELIY